MKRTLTAITAVAALIAGSATAQTLTADSETLTYNLNGFVQSECSLTPNGTVNKNVVMTAVNAQGVGQITFSCNSPYKVTVQSTNGGMKHAQSGGSLLIPYQLRHGGSIGGEAVDYGPYYLSGDLTTEQLLDESTDWLSIASNQGYRNINLDVQFDDDTYAVAGNYSDTLTVTLTAQF